MNKLTVTLFRKGGQCRFFLLAVGGDGKRDDQALSDCYLRYNFLIVHPVTTEKCRIFLQDECETRSAARENINNYMNILIKIFLACGLLSNL